MGGVPEPVESLDRRRQALEVRPGQASVAGVVVLALEEVRGDLQCVDPLAHVDEQRLLPHDAHAVASLGAPEVYLLRQRVPPERQRREEHAREDGDRNCSPANPAATTTWVPS